LKATAPAEQLQKLADINRQLMNFIESEKWQDIPELVEQRGVVISGLIDAVDSYSAEQVEQVKTALTELLVTDELLLKDLYKLQGEDKSALLKIVASNKASKAYVSHGVDL